MKKSKGFTLAELLIVVAIIAVLVAVSIPVFTTQLAKAQLATGLANARADYAEQVTSALAEGLSTIEVTLAKQDNVTIKDDGSNNVVVTHTNGKLSNSFAHDASVTVKVAE